MTEPLNATVIERHDFTHGLFVLRIRPDAGVPDFTPGQYAVLGLPPRAPRLPDADPEETPPAADKLIRRAYSVASGSVVKDYLEFYIALVRGGALTPRLAMLREGDRLWIGPRLVGMFTLDAVPPGRDVVFVATGTGLAPYLSMLRSNYDFHAGHRTLVVHGARHSWDLGYRRELAGLAHAHTRFTYRPVVSEPAGEPRPWPGWTGLVTDPFHDGRVEELLPSVFDPERTSFFLCGNPLMIEGMLAFLGERGFTVHSRRQPGSIVVEMYW